MDEPQRAIDTLVEFARMVSDTTRRPTEIAPHLADAVSAQLDGGGVLVVLLDDAGQARIAAVRGLSAEIVDTPIDLITTELGHFLLGRLDRSFEHADTLLLVSHGGLYGALIVFGDRRPEPIVLRLIAGFVDLTALALDAAFQQQELRETMEALQQSREALARQERLEVLGRMAAVVAHEIKNPLAGISGMLQVLRKRFPEDSKERDVLGSALARVGDLAGQVTDLLTFARPRPPRLVRVSVATLLAGVVAMFEQDPAHTGVDVVIEGWSGKVAVDVDQMSGVVLNLLLNAAQAMEHRGTIRLVAHPPVNGFCSLEVADDGPGIPQDARERIWEAFFTTKTRGTGLGLATARRIVEEHGGSLTVRCPETGGSVFTIEVPC